MQRIKKLRPDQDIKGLIPTIISLIAGACFTVIFDPTAGLKTIGVLVLIYATFSLIEAVRTSGLNYWGSTVYLYCMGLYILFVETRYDHTKLFYLTREAWGIPVWTIFILLWVFYLLITKWAKWRRLDFMEAAAEWVFWISISALAVMMVFPFLKILNRM
jgi:hypothetical protein